MTIHAVADKTASPVVEQRGRRWREVPEAGVRLLVAHDQATGNARASGDRHWPAATGGVGGRQAPWSSLEPLPDGPGCRRDRADRKAFR